MRICLALNEFFILRMTRFCTILFKEIFSVRMELNSKPFEEKRALNRLGLDKIQKQFKK
jgi:hypothetical protein